MRTRVLTATPEQLRLMLLDGALKFARQGREGLLTKNQEAVFEGFTNSRSIVLELCTSMKPAIGADLYSRLQGLYMFIYQELIDASFNRDVGKAEHAIKLLEFERETWVLAMDKLAKERAATNADATDVAVAELMNTSSGDRRPLSVQG